VTSSAADFTGYVTAGSTTDGVTDCAIDSSGSAAHNASSAARPLSAETDRLPLTMLTP
jgi:hypothetical protein